MNSPIESFSTLFDLIGDLARRRFRIGERAFATLGLNHTEARLLTLLKQHQGQTTQDVLSNLLSVDRSNAGRALKGLEAGRYVVRSKDSVNGKTNLVKLSSKGLKTALVLEKLRIDMAQSFFGKLTEEQAQTIIELLDNALKDHPRPETGDAAGNNEVPTGTRGNQ